MNLKKCLSTCAVFSALALSAFSAYGQTITIEKTGSVTDYSEESGIVRNRAVESKKSTVRPTDGQLFEMEKLAFSIVNQRRAENGLAAVAWSDEVAKVARMHSENMVRFKFFAHQGVDGKSVDDRADSIGLTRWTLIGENIAYNRGYENPVETAVEKWMLSPSHRENILNYKWKESAVGIAVTDEGTYYFTQVFIKRK